MDLYKELVHGKGYAVCPIENMQLFKKLRDSFVDKMNISTKSEKNINVRYSMSARVPLLSPPLPIYAAFCRILLTHFRPDGEGPEPRFVDICTIL